MSKIRLAIEFDWAVRINRNGDFLTPLVSLICEMGFSLVGVADLPTMDGGKRRALFWKYYVRRVDLGLVRREAYVANRAVGKFQIPVNLKRAFVCFAKLNSGTRGANMWAFSGIIRVVNRILYSTFGGEAARS